MYSDLEKIKEKKEKKIKEYYKAYLGGTGLDTIAIQSLKDKKFTKKRKRKVTPQRTHKQIKSSHIKIDEVTEKQKQMAKKADSEQVNEVEHK
jgi:glycine cleavage system pyridoxal-binding protein P